MEMNLGMKLELGRIWDMVCHAETSLRAFNNAVKADLPGLNDLAILADALKGLIDADSAIDTVLNADEDDDPYDGYQEDFHADC